MQKSTPNHRLFFILLVFLSFMFHHPSFAMNSASGSTARDTVTIEKGQKQLHFRIDKNTSTQNLEKLREKLKDWYGIKFRFSRLKRNAKAEITRLKLKLKFKKHNLKKKQQKQGGIDPFYIEMNQYEQTPSLFLEIIKNKKIAKMLNLATNSPFVIFNGEKIKIDSLERTLFKIDTAEIGKDQQLHLKGEKIAPGFRVFAALKKIAVNNEKGRYFYFSEKKSYPRMNIIDYKDKKHIKVYGVLDNIKGLSPQMRYIALTQAKIAVVDPSRLVNDYDKNKDDDKKGTKTKLEKTPGFPGCTNGQDLKKQKKCISQKIQQFAGKHFNSSLLDNSSSSTKRYSSVLTSLTIDKDGSLINLIAIASKKELAEESIRILKNLPEFTPGKANGEFVRIIFGLPFVIAH